MLERKRRLRELIEAPGPTLYLDRVASAGIDLFDAVCASEMEGIVAKLAEGRHTPRRPPGCRSAQAETAIF